MTELRVGTGSAAADPRPKGNGFSDEASGFSDEAKGFADEAEGFAYEEGLGEEDSFVFPVSYAQQRLWFLDRFEPGSPFYNIPIAVRLTGGLDFAALRRALDEIARRHEILRTTFEVLDGEPVQVVSPPGRAPLPVVDLQGLPEAQREVEALRLAQEEARLPFDLRTGPLMRVKLLRLAGDDYVVLLTMHHIISDGWSIGVLIKEIVVLYSAFFSGLPAPLEELPIQYADFAVWQREWLQGEVLEAQLTYWREQLGGDLPVLELPADRARPAVQTSRGAVVSGKLSPELTEALKRLGRRENATLFMILLAAFQTLLARYTGQTSISVGSPIANRNRAEIEPLIGFFVNTLVLKTDLAGNPTFREVVRRVREVTLGAYANQDLPFEMLVEVLQPQRDMSHNPLFQVMFILQNTQSAVGTRSEMPSGVIEMPGVSLSFLDVHSGTSTFDLTLSMAEEASGLDAAIEYNTDLFGPRTISRMLDHFQVLLEGAVAHPDWRIGELPLLTLSERRQILVAWNDTTVEHPLDLCVHQLVEAQARQAPDATAVVLPGTLDQPRTTLTYGALNSEANQLARYLRDLGVGPESRVGICLARSLEMIVAVLAVLKAGGGYVPLDPQVPGERLSYVLEDAAVTGLLTHTALLAGLPAHHGWSVCLDRDWNLIGQKETVDLPNLTQPQNLAYVVYTSGSTGQAKGTLVEHRNLANAYFAWQDAYHLDRTGIHLQMANFTFDVFSADYVRALCAGGTLVLCPREWLLVPEQLYALMQQEAVTCAEFVPVVLRHFVQYLEDSHQRLDGLKVLACGSDSWYVREYLRFRRRFGQGTRLINSFGLTEATVDSTYFEGPIRDLSTEQMVPIGRAFANTQLYVLDANLQPLPVGVSGELYIGGHGVARGYHRRPALTAERFVPNPFRDEVGAERPEAGDRLYRTGDLARYLPDGNIEFLGRVDHQVKIRGFRIEPGEIEAVLSGHPAVHQVAVVPVEAEDGGGRRLAAYVIPNDSRETSTGCPPLGAGCALLSAGDLRRFLQERLPDYMIPAAFMALKEFPLLSSGKINRQALPAPDWSQRDLETQAIPPRTPVEQMLADVWRDILGVAEVGVFDDFFELGGHSLLATQVISRIREGFGLELPLRRIFESSTIAELAEVIEMAQHEGAGLQAPPIVRVSRDQPLPLSFSQQRLWFLDQLDPGSPLYNLTEAIQVSGDLDVALLERCLNEVVRRHEVLRTTFKTVDGKPYQDIAPELHVPLQVVDPQDLSEAEREALTLLAIQEEAQQPFDLAQGPLLRARLLRLGSGDDGMSQDTIILLTVHHIIGDDWSSNVLIQEITALYSALGRGDPAPASPLSDLPIQYADFAAWQRAWLQGEVRDKLLAYWKAQLRDLPPLLALPTDRPRSAEMTSAGAYRTFRLPARLSEQVNALGQTTGTTLFMVLLAAFQSLLYRYTGEVHISVGTPIANRNHAELERLIGFFVNTLVLCTDFSGEPSFREVLQRVREVALGAYTHQDLPFDVLVDALQPERDLSHSPLFQVMFVLQNAPQRIQALPGMTMSAIEAHSGTAKFDLTLFMVDEGEQLSGALEYNTDLFSAETMASLLEHFERLLEGVLNNPDLPISQVPLLGEEERDRWVLAWNAMLAPYPDVCAHRLFEAQAARTPDAVAVRYLDQTLTYAELERQANQMAHTLQAMGVRPETRVGLCVERSPDLAVAILGVLKAGGAYVPLDPAYPEERLAFMIHDADIAVLLTQSQLLEHLPELSMPALCLDTDRARYSTAPEMPPASSVAPANLAYVIYTSGSTGKPKGAMLVHSGLVNYLTWCQQAYPLDGGQGAPVHSSISFDLTITSLLAPLVSGRAVHLLPEGEGVETLARALRDVDDFSLVKITPAHLMLLAQQLGEAQGAGRTRAFIIGGEALLAEHVQFWLAHAPQTMLVNEYGPTETVVGCCVYQVPQDWHEAGAVAIGRPIINTRLYVLDAWMQPVPVGVLGELYIGGAQVGRGYMKRPGLTAERFVPDPFSETPGARLYRTGDLVRHRRDGNLEYIGRMDDQVKVRGFRVELGEVESALSAHPQVQAVAVMAPESAAGHRQLVAYLVPRGKAPNVNELREFLLRILPEHMVPSIFVSMPALPLTAHGKVDRRALPAPEGERPELARAYLAPRAAVEVMLAGIWSQVLGVERVGVEDNFFELGGDSILSIQVIARANQAGLKVTPKQFFEHPTVAQLALVTEPGRVIQAEQGPVEGPASLTPIQSWFIEQNLPRPNHWNQSLLLAVAERLNTTALREAVQHLLAHHDMLRARFIAGPDGWRQEMAGIGGDVPFAHVDLSHLPSAEQAQRVEAAASEVQASLDLANGPVVRVVYYDLGPQRPGRLLIVVHHLVVDGVSWAVLLEDLLSAYQQVRQEIPVRLPPKTTSFKHWAERLAAYASAPELGGEVETWARIAGASPGHLPVDFVDGDNTEGSTESVAVGLSAEETLALLHDVPPAYHTEINEVLLTALAAAVSDWTGADSILIDLESHGREDLFDDVDVSRTVGWFTALYPVRLRLTGSSLVDQVLDIQEQLRRVPHHGIGYGILRFLGGQREPDHQIAPVYPELSFNYLGQLDRIVAADSPFGPAAESRGAERDPQGQRQHLIEVDGGIAGGRLQMEWTYSRNVHARRSIASLAEAFAARLRDLIAQAQAVETPRVSASDVDAFGWTEGDLGDILAELDEVLR